ncbi:MAG: STAS domain-containing protein [Phycisphaerae bacterium]|jgi:anti-anti-sigma factor
MTDSNIATITTEKDFTLVTFNVASLTAGSGLEDITQKISEIVKDAKPRNLIIDFKGIKFFSSQTLGILLDARKKVAAYNGNIVISSINPQLYRVFKITNLDKIFKFYPDASSAIADLKK